eukprot:m51a1_g1388 hypothetical protein (320) ;mRNA; r:466438-467459
MEVLHSRVVPSAMHTLDDLVFAAFQGPVLSLSSRVLYRHHSFTVLLLLRRHWREVRSLSQSQVTAALLSAKCCWPDSLAMATCRECGTVLRLSRNPEEEASLRAQLPLDVELYAATVRTGCTSSRKHVGSAMLVLASDLAPGTVVVSQRFAIYARHAARHVGNKIADAEVLSAADQVLLAHQEKLPPSELLGRSTISPLLLASPMGPDPRSLGPVGGISIGVRISAVKLSQEEEQKLTKASVSVLQEHVPGYLFHKSCYVASAPVSVVIIIIGTTSYDGLLAVARYMDILEQNVIRNPFNRNLITSEIVQTVLTTSNMT